jgi:hypothetical protein
LLLSLPSEFPWLGCFSISILPWKRGDFTGRCTRSVRPAPGALGILEMGYPGFRARARPTLGNPLDSGRSPPFRRAQGRQVRGCPPGAHFAAAGESPTRTRFHLTTLRPASPPFRTVRAVPDRTLPLQPPTSAFTVLALILWTILSRSSPTRFSIVNCDANFFALAPIRSRRR